jgi:hypothetical protein
MSTPPVLRQGAAPKPISSATPDTTVQARAPAKRAPLEQRLPDMSDSHLLSLQAAATRIARDPMHGKFNSATAAIPLIDAEIGRRTQALAGSEGEQL